MRLDSTRTLRSFYKRVVTSSGENEGKIWGTRFKFLQLQRNRLLDGGHLDWKGGTTHT